MGLSDGGHDGFWLLGKIVFGWDDEVVGSWYTQDAEHNSTISSTPQKSYSYEQWPHAERSIANHNDQAFGKGGYTAEEGSMRDPHDRGGWEW